MGKIRRLWPTKRKIPALGFTISVTVNKCEPCTNCGAIIMGRAHVVQVKIGAELKTISNLCQVCQKMLNDENGDTTAR